nr:hypothetical protein I308_03707 [Cryptococcus tetragattii IND107]
MAPVEACSQVIWRGTVEDSMWGGHFMVARAAS